MIGTAFFLGTMNILSIILYVGCIQSVRDESKRNTPITVQRNEKVITLTRVSLLAFFIIMLAISSLITFYLWYLGFDALFK